MPMLSYKAVDKGFVQPGLVCPCCHPSRGSSFQMGCVSAVILAVANRCCVLMLLVKYRQLLTDGVTWRTAAGNSKQVWSDCVSVSNNTQSCAGVM